MSAAVDGAGSLRALLADLTALLVDRCDTGELAALRTCVDTGYWHPRLTTPDVSAARLRPWIVPLEEGWCWLRPVWRDPLRRELVAGRGRDSSTTTGGSAGPRPRAAPVAPAGVLQAGLLGDLEVRVDGRVVRWRGRRGASVLRFLLARPRRACRRDELLATFWPDVAPEVARNRLQVAVSGLRRAFGEVTRVNVIEYAAEGYRINPALRVKVDVERFESALDAAKHAERAGDAARALACYREAVGDYRGDFAADAPSEHWAVVPRESLRIAFVDALGQVGRLELARGACDESIAAARRMLDSDPCREDAHRLLMCCYARQGRPYQASRQFELCRQVLRSVLDVEPARDTVRLHDRIRAGSAPEPALIGRWTRALGHRDGTARLLDL